jgi:hypothetical protein
MFDASDYPRKVIIGIGKQNPAYVIGTVFGSGSKLIAQADVLIRPMQALRTRQCKRLLLQRLAAAVARLLTCLLLLQTWFQSKIFKIARSPPASEISQNNSAV